MDEICPCTREGWCPHYGMSVVGRLWQLSREDSERGRAYRRLWREKAAAAGDGPGWLEKGWNFVKAGVAHVADGCARVDDETRATRLSLCIACEHYVQEVGCLKCGCALKTHAALVDKLGWRSSKCPVGKW